MLTEHKCSGERVICSTEARSLIRPGDKNLDRMKGLLRQDLGPLVARVDKEACLYCGGAVDKHCALVDISRHVHTERTDIGRFEKSIEVVCRGRGSS